MTHPVCNVIKVSPVNIVIKVVVRYATFSDFIFVYNTFLLVFSLVRRWKLA